MWLVSKGIDGRAAAFNVAHVSSVSETDGGGCLFEWDDGGVLETDLPFTDFVAALGSAVIMASQVAEKE